MPFEQEPACAQTGSRSDGIDDRANRSRKQDTSAVDQRCKQ